MPYTVHVGPCLRVLRTLPDNSVHSIVTDPPYGLGFMGKTWDRLPTVAVFRECLRVLRPGGHIAAFGHTRTYHHLATRIERAGFEIRDMIAWTYGQGFPKSRNQDGAWKGWGTALKPALEPIALARKPLDGTVEANLADHGAGALNIDGCRVPLDRHVDESQLRTMHRNVRTEADGWGMNKLADEQTPVVNERGRWPANIVHDGSPDVLEAFPDAPGQQGDLKAHAEYRQSPNGIFGGMRPAIDHAARNDAGSAARFFYCAKATRADREEGLAAFEKQPAGIVSNTSGRRIAEREGYTQPVRANTHPTVKPTALMRWLVKLITPPGGIVLDPFAGSGSTGKAAVLDGFEAVLIERDRQWKPVIAARCAWAEANRPRAQQLALALET